MSQIRRFNVTEAIAFVSNAMKVDPTRVFRRAGLPPDFLTHGARPLSAEEYYDLWDAFEAEEFDVNFLVQMAQKVVDSGFDSSVYSFYSSPTVRVGLQRKALLKPLIMPIFMRVTDYEQHLAVSFMSAIKGRALPVTIGWFNILYFVKAIRHATGLQIVPAAVEVERAVPGAETSDGFLGCHVMQGSGYRLVLSADTGRLPLDCRNDALWAPVETGLQDRFLQTMPPETTASRVRQALIDGLPGGQATAEQIARHLAMSKRSLQRRLSEEGVSFKDVLEDTRRALSMNYLTNTNMSMQEIAYLLGFRDPSSFFRAFRGWTGKTPQSLRDEAAFA